MAGTVRVWAVAGVLLAVGTLMGRDAAAIARYEYVGNFYDTIRDDTPPDGAYTTTMQVTGYLTFSEPLAPNLTNEFLDSEVLDSSLSDGRQTLSNSDRLFTVVSTDAGGNIIDWLIGASTGGEGTEYRLIGTSGSSRDEARICADPCVFDIGSNEILSPYDEALSLTPGSWTLIPEPSTALLAGLGLTVLAASRRRRTGRVRLSRTSVAEA